MIVLRDSTGCVEVTAAHAIVPKVYICTCTPLFLVELVRIIGWQARCMTAIIVLSDWFLLAFVPYFNPQILGIAAVCAVKAGLAEDHAQVSTVHSS